jgi:uncharacterized protein YegL
VCFVIDGSDSISDANFKKLRTSIAGMVDGFNIGSGETRMGIVVYSKGVPFKVPLSDDPVYLTEQALAMPHPREGTETHLGIAAMLEIFRKQRREGVPMAGIVVTDGISKDDEGTLFQAQMAKDEGINMFSVGVGRYTDEKELRGIASTRTQAINVTSFDELMPALQELVQLVCPSM